MSALLLTLVTLSKETQMFSSKKIYFINLMSLSWEKFMLRVTKMTSCTMSRRCSITPISHLQRNRPDLPLSCRRIRSSTKYLLKRWMESERTSYRSTWGILLLNNRVGLEVLLKRPHSGTTSFRGCWWMRNAGKICLLRQSQQDFQFLLLEQRQGCFNNHSKNLLRRVLSLIKKEVKN